MNIATTEDGAPLCGAAVSCAKTARAVSHHGGMRPFQRDALHWLHVERPGRVISFLESRRGKSVVGQRLESTRGMSGVGKLHFRGCACGCRAGAA